MKSSKSKPAVHFADCLDCNWRYQEDDASRAAEKHAKDNGHRAEVEFLYTERFDGTPDNPKPDTAPSESL